MLKIFVFKALLFFSSHEANLFDQLSESQE